MAQRITARQAGAIVRRFLKDRGIDCRVTAKSVSFEDLARCERVFVCADGLPVDVRRELQEIAQQHGFYLQ